MFDCSRRNTSRARIPVSSFSSMIGSSWESKGTVGTIVDKSTVVGDSCPFVSLPLVDVCGCDCSLSLSLDNDGVGVVAILAGVQQAERGENEATTIRIGHWTVHVHAIVEFRGRCGGSLEG